MRSAGGGARNRRLVGGVHRPDLRRGHTREHDEQVTPATPERRRRTQSDLRISEEEIAQQSYLHARPLVLQIACACLTSRDRVSRSRRVISLLERAGYTLVACISEWRYHIYDLIFVRPEHFADGAAADASPSARPERLADGADDALPSARARSGQLPARAEAYLRAHHEDRTHDVLRCKAVEANATRRLAFEITPPAALVAPAQG